MFYQFQHHYPINKLDIINMDSLHHFTDYFELYFILQKKYYQYYNDSYHFSNINYIETVYFSQENPSIDIFRANQGIKDALIYMIFNRLYPRSTFQPLLNLFYYIQFISIKNIQFETDKNLMIQEKSLTAKCFLKSNAIRERIQCGICFEICIKPVKCQGSCNRIYCMKCVSDTRLVMDKCPYRCSSPFLVSPMPQLQLQFYCPYNASLCTTKLSSIKHFQKHYKQCQFVSPQQLHIKKMKEEYKCLNNHQLQFFIGTYQEMINLPCRQCQQVKLCRSFCRICQEYYCVDCRIPPCSKEGCPVGHQFNFQRIANLNYICDVCGISTAVSNDGVYDDHHCNFGICQACYSNLPQHFDQSRPKQIIANINTQCSCTHPLIYVDSKYTISSCQLCKRQKECPKYCQNCEKRYCIDCKIMDIYPDHTCSLDHKQEKISLQSNRPLMQKQSHFGCMKCSKVFTEYYYDQECHTRLCQTCYKYFIKIYTDKERPILMKCNKNHILNYISGEQDYVLSCSSCKKDKIIKLACNFCQQDQRFYCFQCRPIVLQTCYYQHRLKQEHFDQQRQCHFCMKNFNNFFFCKKCLFYACLSCKNLHSQPKNVITQSLNLIQY